MLEVLEPMSPAELLKEELKLRMSTFDNEKKQLGRSFEQKLQSEKIGEDEHQHQSRREYFQQSLDKLLLLKKNDIIDGDNLKTQLDRLNGFQGLDREQKVNYDTNLLKMLKMIKLAGEERVIDVPELDEKGYFLKIRNNPEERLFVEKRFREKEKNINQILEKYSPDELQMYLYNLATKDELDSLK